MKSEICLFLLVAAFAACTDKPKESPVTGITIKHTEFERQTLTRMNSQSFDEFFKDAPEKKLTAKPEIDSLMDELYIMKNIDNENTPDVRCKIYITHADKKIDTVLMDKSVLKYKGRTYQTPKELLLRIDR